MDKYRVLDNELLLNKDLSTLIGFCIPAYKRPALLEKCLDSIIRNAKPYSIPIFISDDSGDLSNSVLLNKKIHEYDRIFVHRNKKNIGIDENIINSISLCTAKYAWLIGEDDLLAEGAVEKLYTVIVNNEDLPFVAANYCRVSNDYSRVINPNVFAINADLLIRAELFIEQYIWAIGFIGACIVNKKYWLKSNSDQFIGTYFAHIATILPMIKDKNVFVIATPMVLNRAEDSNSFSWKDKAFDVYYGWERMLANVCIKHYNKKLFFRALKNSQILFMKKSLVWLISLRAEGILTPQTYYEYMRGRYNLFYSLIAFIISMIPQNKLVYMVDIIKRIKHFYREN